MRPFPGSFFKAEKAKRSKGRDRPDVPLEPWCQIAHPGICTGRAEHRHHVILRSQGGDGGPTIDCCHQCHEFAHRNRAVARAHGWIIDRQAS